MAVGERERTIDVGGRRLGWRELGAGPPLVLVNGYAASAADWDPTFLAALAGSFALICPDNRGTGASELGDAGALSVDAMAGDVEALLDALAIERATLVGWSMGGFVAQRLALRTPARVASMALLATNPPGAAATPAGEDVLRRLTDHSGTPREQASRLIALLFPAPLAEAIDAEFGEIVAAARAALPPQTLAAQERVLAEWFATAQPPPGADAPPAIVVHGELDVIAVPANADALASLWHARVELIAGAGHAFMAQEPLRVAALIDGFATREPARR